MNRLGDSVLKFVLVAVLLAGSAYGGYQYGRYSAFQGLVNSGLGIFDDAGRFDIKGSIKKFIEERKDRPVSILNRCCQCCPCDCGPKTDCGCGCTSNEHSTGSSNVSALCCSCCDCRHLVVRDCRCEGCAID